KYPFLDDIWNKYNFDKDLEVSEVNNQIISSCDGIIGYNDDNIVNHKKVCKKLLRNLKLLHSGSYRGGEFVKCCNNIYNWLYYEISEHNISDDTINNIFAVSKQIIKKQGLLDCPYFTFNIGLLEPEKLVMLRIFNNNIDDIQEFLKKEINSNTCSCQKFMNKCVDIYKRMHGDHCSKGDITIPPKKVTCEIVNNFKTYYEAYLSKEMIKYELPELYSNTPINIIDGCPSEEIKSGQASPVQRNQSDRSIIQSSSHALGAMAGIPPFLALIYK
ncbi:Plasmodium vivax Vir protein, putative, partial [Plasmodium vivax]